MLCASSSLGQTLTWKDSGGTWTEPDANNWVEGTYNTGSNVQFTGSDTVNIDAGGVTPGSVLVDSSGDYTFSSGGIGGSGSFTKTNNGTLSLSGSNTYSGATIIYAGTLNLPEYESAALSGAANITFAGDSTLAHTLHTGSLTLSQPVVINPNVTATFDRGGGGGGTYFRFDGGISGGGTLSFTTGGGGSGQGRFYLNNAASFTGTVQVASDYNANTTINLYFDSLGDGGKLRTAASNASGNLQVRYTGSGAIFNTRQCEIAGAAGMTVYGDGTGALVINTPLSVTAASARTLTLRGGSTGNNEFAGSITNGTSSVISLTKTDGGTWILSGSNTYSGGTTLSSGVLKANSTNALGNGGVTVNGGVLVIDQPGSLGAAAALSLPSESTKNITMNADLTVAKLFVGGVQQPFGVYTSSGAGSGWMNTGSGSLIVGSASQILYWDRNGASAGAGATPDGAWDGTAQNWNAASDGTGPTNTWVEGKAAVFSAGTDATGPYTVTVAGTRQISGLSFEEGSITVSGGTALEMVDDVVAFVESGATATNLTPITEDSTARALTKSGEGTLTLAGTNSFTGQLTVGQGTLKLGVDDPFTAPPKLTMVNNSTAVFDLDVNSVTVASLSGGGTSGGNVDLGEGTLTLGTDNLDSTYSGGISGSGGITKDGSGTFKIIGVNSFTGDIAIDGGMLQVGDNNTACQLSGDIYTGNVSIAAGAKLFFNNSQAEELTGVISGEGSLQKAGSQILTLSGSNTYIGKTSIAGAGGGGPQMSVSSFNSVSNNPALGTVHSASSSLGAPTNVADATIDLGSSGNLRNCTLIYTGSGETTDRIIHLSFNDRAVHTIRADTTGGGLLKFVSPFTVTRSSGKIDYGLCLEGSGDAEMLAGLPDMPGYLKKQGAGAWTLGGSSSYDGSTTVSDGTLNVNAAGALSTGDVVISGGTLVANATNALVTNTSVTVSGGTLEIAGVDCLSDTNSLTINSGTVQLNAGVKEVIGSLYFGVELQTNGIWGATNSTAQFKSTYFDGTGKLYVGVPIPASGMVLIVR